MRKNLPNSIEPGQPNWVQALPLYYTSFTLLNRRWRNADTSVDWPSCIKFWTNMWQCRWISWIWFCVIDLSDDLLLNKDLRYLVMLQLSFRTCRVGCFSFFFWLRVLDKAEYSAFQSTLNSPIVSYRIQKSFAARGVARSNNVDTYGERIERQPIRGSGGGAPRGPGPLVRGSGAKPLEAENLLAFGAQRTHQICLFLCILQTP